MTHHLPVSEVHCYGQHPIGHMMFGGIHVASAPMMLRIRDANTSLS